MIADIGGKGARRTTGKNLVGRWRPSLTRVGHQLFVFGGGGHVTTDLHVLDLNTLRWSNVETEGQPPSKRYGHSASMYRNWIVIFGGSNEVQEYCSDVVIFDVTSREWFRPEIGGQRVTARYLHTAVVYGTKLYVYGGFAKNTEMTYVLEDLSILDLENFTWTTVSTSVPARYNHTATLVGHKMYIYAGKDESGNTVSDILYYDISTSKIVRHDGVTGEVALLKSQHFAEAVNDRILVFGRYISNPSTNEYSHGLWQFDIERLEWKQLEILREFSSGVWNYFTALEQQCPKSSSCDEEPGVQQMKQSCAEQDVRLIFLGNTESHRLPPYDHFRDYISMDVETLGIFKIPSPELSHDLGGLLDDPELSDFIILPKDGAPLHVHKTILIARWPHFRNVFKSGMRESAQSTMHIPEPRNVLLAFLHYVYTDKIPDDTTWDVVGDVLVLAGLYFLPRLRKLCSHRLMNHHLTPDTCGRIFQQAIVAQETGLKLQVVRYIFQNYGPVLKSESLSQLPPHIRNEFLQCVPDDAALTTAYVPLFASRKVGSLVVPAAK